MTAEQKIRLASFLDLTADTLRDGYTEEREPYTFTDSPSPPAPQAGAEESAQPLVMVIGKGLNNGNAAAELLDKMLASIDLYRGKNCAVGGAGQIEVPGPRVILCAGAAAAADLLGPDENNRQGQFCDYRGTEGTTIPMLTTYHPDELLQNPSLKRPAWEDLKTLRARLMELDQDYARTVSSIEGR